MKEIKMQKTTQQYIDKITKKTVTFVQAARSKNLVIVRHRDGSFQMMYKFMLTPIVQ
jgi:hypothetical protein